MELTYCLTCGIETTDQQPLRGRKREFCGRACKDFRNLMDAAQRALDIIEFKTSSKVRGLAREMFQTYNDLHNLATKLERDEQRR